MNEDVNVPEYPSGGNPPSQELESETEQSQDEASPEPQVQPDVQAEADSEDHGLTLELESETEQSQDEANPEPQVKPDVQSEAEPQDHGVTLELESEAEQSPGDISSNPQVQPEPLNISSGFLDTKEQPQRLPTLETQPQLGTQPESPNLSSGFLDTKQQPQSLPTLETQPQPAESDTRGNLLESQGEFSNSFVGHSLEDLVAQRKSEKSLAKKLRKQIDSRTHLLGSLLIEAFCKNEISNDSSFSSVLTQRRQLASLNEELRVLGNETPDSFKAKIKHKASKGMLVGKIKIEEANLKKMVAQLGKTIIANDRLLELQSETSAALVKELTQLIEEVREVDLRISNLDYAVNLIQP